MKRIILLWACCLVAAALLSSAHAQQLLWEKPVLHSPSSVPVEVLMSMTAVRNEEIVLQGNYAPHAQRRCPTVFLAG